MDAPERCRCDKEGARVSESAGSRGWRVIAVPASALCRQSARVAQDDAAIVTEKAQQPAPNGLARRLPLCARQPTLALRHICAGSLFLCHAHAHAPSEHGQSRPHHLGCAREGRLVITCANYPLILLCRPVAVSTKRLSLRLCASAGHSSPASRNHLLVTYTSTS